MFNPGKVLIGFAVCLGATSTAFAGLMPASGLFAGQQCPAVFCEKDSHAQGNPAQICYPSSTDLALYPGALFPEADANHRQTSETQPLLRLTNATTSSFDLCLYALIGLGICRTGPWIKRLSYGSVPEWFHDGGPLQIGHSHAVMPKTLCSASVCCFVQPDGHQADEQLPTQSQRAAISPLLRKSLFTPCVLASRGPP